MRFLSALPLLCGMDRLEITQEIPPQPQLLISALVAAGILFFSYQYLLMVYGGTTLGLRACRLELVALDGTIPGRKQRRWRLLAALLSAASLMLGYAWFCWTKTACAGTTALPTPTCVFGNAGRSPRFFPLS